MTLPRSESESRDGHSDAIADPQKGPEAKKITRTLPALLVSAALLALGAPRVSTPSLPTSHPTSYPSQAAPTEQRPTAGAAIEVDPRIAACSQREDSAPCFQNLLNSDVAAMARWHLANQHLANQHPANQSLAINPRIAFEHYSLLATDAEFLAPLIRSKVTNWLKTFVLGTTSAEDSGAESFLASLSALHDRLSRTADSNSALWSYVLNPATFGQSCANSCGVNACADAEQTALCSFWFQSHGQTTRARSLATSGYLDAPAMWFSQKLLEVAGHPAFTREQHLRLAEQLNQQGRSGAAREHYQAWLSVRLSREDLSPAVRYALLLRRTNPESRLESLLRQIEPMAEQLSASELEIFLDLRTQLGDIERRFSALRLLASRCQTAHTTRACDALTRLVRRIRGGDLVVAPGDIPSCETLQHTGALFEVGWHHYQTGNMDQATECLSRINTPETTEGRVGQTNYWRGVISSRTQDTEAARTHLCQAVGRYPTYYGWLASLRLTQLNLRCQHSESSYPAGRDVDEQAQVALQSLRNANLSRTITFLWRAADYPAIFTELQRTNEGGAAIAFLKAWSADRQQTFHQSVEVYRQALRFDRMDLGPITPSALGVGYPNAFDLFDTAASVRGLDPSFLRALGREESSFRRDAQSWARAYGVMQLLRGTANRMSQRIQESPRASRLTTLPMNNLHHPDVSIELGAEYVSLLSTHFGGFLGAIPSGYNAGEGATSSWIRARGELPFDVWVEEIPYEETRKYTRRVLQSYCIYRRLAGQALPDLNLSRPMNALTARPN